jgi:hypothetical protein
MVPPWQPDSKMPQAKLQQSAYRTVAITLALLIRTAVSAAQVQEGRVEWAPEDVAISVKPGGQGISGASPGIVVLPDGAGGVFVVWVDLSVPTLMAQRLDAAGQRLWTTGGIPVVDAMGFKLRPSAVSDSAGGIIVIWVDGRNTPYCTVGFMGECDVYAQRLSAQGQRLWGVDGVPVSTAPANQGVSGVAVTADGAGGAFVAWEDARPPCCTYFAQRLLPSGNRAWGLNDLQVGPTPTVLFGPVALPPQIVVDGAGGVFVAYVDQQRPPAFDQRHIVLQRFNSAGAPQLAGWGRDLGSHGYREIAMLPDGAGGVYLGWVATPFASSTDDTVDVFRLGPTGDPLWDSHATLSSSRGRKRSFVFEADGLGGVIAAWEDSRHSEFGSCSAAANCDIFAQRVSAAGLTLWARDGLAVETSPGLQTLPLIGPDDAGGATFVWLDCRAVPQRDACISGSDIYAQRVDVAGEKRWPGGAVAVSRAAGNQGEAPGVPPEQLMALAPDQEGGVIVVWPDGRHELCENIYQFCDVYAQRVGEQPARHPWALSALVDGHGVFLSWEPPATGNAATYRLEVGSQPGLSDLLSLPLGATVQLAAQAASGLYYVRVRAVLLDGTLSAPSNELAVRVGCSGPPVAPTSLVAAIQGTQVTFAWSAAPGVAQAFVLEAGSATAQADIAVLPVGTGLTFTASAPLGTYFVRVRAANSCGTSRPSGEVFVSVGSGAALPAVPQITAVSVVSGVVVLSWPAPSGGVVGYQLEAGSSAGAADLVTLRVPASNQFAARAPRGTYHVRLRAMSAAGTGPPSADVVVTVP